MSLVSASLLLPSRAFAADWEDELAQGQEATEEAGDTTEQIPTESGDVVETLQPDATESVHELSPAPAAEAATTPASRTQISGYVRQSLETNYGQLLREARAPAIPGGDVPAPTLWRDVFLSRTQLALRGSYLKGRHFEATISGVLGYTLHVAKEAPQYSVDVISGARGDLEVKLTRGELDADLRDAYLGFFWPGVDLRIGQQRVAWGRTDFQSPNDVINARDLRDPLLGETELRYLPTPLVRASFSSGVVTFEGIVAPIFVPDRFDAYGSNWSALQERAPGQLLALVGRTSTVVDTSVERDLASLWRQTELPANDGKGAAAGARISASLSSTDLSAYYHYGYDSLPFVSASQTFLNYLRDTDLQTMGVAATLAPLLTELDSGGRPLSARYLRRHHVGFDVSTILGAWTLRLDAAYQSQRVFYDANLLSVASPTLLGVAAVEYQTGSLDDVFILELLGARLLDAPATGLLGYRRDSSAVAGTLRWTLVDSWGIDLRGVVGLAPQTYTLQPALQYKPNDAFSVRVGALVVSGERGSFGWYYGDNDTAFVQLRWGF